MAHVLEQVALDAQANFRRFTDWMTENRAKVALFQIGPYRIGDAANATVGTTVELLEAKGYKAEVGVNVLTAVPGPSGNEVVFTALATLVVRAPGIVSANFHT